jgi:hypothetical protein
MKYFLISLLSIYGVSSLEAVDIYCCKNGFNEVYDINIDRDQYGSHSKIYINNRFISIYDYNDLIYGDHCYFTNGIEKECLK